MDQGSTYGGLIIAPGHVHDIIMEPESREGRGPGMQAIGLSINSRILALPIGLRPFRQVADTWPLGPADNQPNPCQPI